jgi:hypothetical protein
VCASRTDQCQGRSSMGSGAHGRDLAGATAAQLTCALDAAVRAAARQKSAMWESIFQPEPTREATIRLSRQKQVSKWSARALGGAGARSGLT